MKESYVTTLRLAIAESAPTNPDMDFVKDAAGSMSVVTPSGVQTLATAQTVASAIIAGAAPNWALSTAVEVNQLRIATVALGTIRVGDILRSLSTRATGAVFDAAEAAN